MYDQKKKYIYCKLSFDPKTNSSSISIRYHTHIYFAIKPFSSKAVPESLAASLKLLYQFNLIPKSRAISRGVRSKAAKLLTSLFGHLTRR